VMGNVTLFLNNEKITISVSNYSNWGQISFINSWLIKVIEKIKEKWNFKLTEKEVAQWIVWAPDEEYLIKDIN
jgi:hypothetical protein